MQTGYTMTDTHVTVILDTLEELREYVGLSPAQLALLGDLRRMRGTPTTIRATLGERGVAYLPVRVGAPRPAHPDCRDCGPSTAQGICPECLEVRR